MKILNTEVIKYCDEKLLITLFIIGFIFFVITLFALNTDVISICTAVLCVGFLIAGFISMIVTDGYSQRNQYEVILDDNYPASELYKNYNIVEQRGEIWVIEDKEATINDKGKK